MGGYVVAKGHCPLQKTGERVRYARWLEYGGRLRVALTDTTEYVREKKGFLVSFE